MFIKHSGEGGVTVLVVYEDGIKREMDRLKASLAIEFEIKDLGPLKYFLGNEVTRSKKDSGLSKKVHPRPSKGDKDEWVQADKHTN